LWGWNKDRIKDPHWIYPGDVLTLDRYAPGGPRLSVNGGHPTIRLSPGTRIEELGTQAIPAIPAGDLEPYLTRSIVTDRAGLDGAAEIVAGRERGRITRGAGDRIYAVGLDPNAGHAWYIYRPGKTLLDTDEKHTVLGYENRFIGVARVDRFGAGRPLDERIPEEVSTLTITQANEEVFIGDRLLPVPPETLLNYVPHAPKQDVSGHIIASYGNSSEMGRGNIVTLDRGTRDGIDVGTVLAVYQSQPLIKDPRPNQTTPVILSRLEPTTIFTPDHYLEVPVERVGLMFVFRTFDRVSYALLLNATDPVVVGDSFRQP
jgi:hypothetical protein